MSWQVFVGLRDNDGDIEYASTDTAVRHWLDAKMLILDQLRAFEGDVCATCEADAAEATESLAAVTHATDWSGEVEGTEYSITLLAEALKARKR